MPRRVIRNPVPEPDQPADVCSWCGMRATSKWTSRYTPTPIFLCDEHLPTFAEGMKKAEYTRVD